MVSAARIGGRLPKSDLQEEAADTIEVLANAQGRLDRVTSTLNELPVRTVSLKAKRDGMAEVLAHLRKEVNDSISLSHSAKKQGPANQILVLAELMKVVTFDMELIPLQEAVAETARRNREKSEAIYDECSYTYWALHLIGWGIGLTGVLFGLKDPSD